MIKLRGSHYQLYRRVPKRFASIESRKFVWISLKTDSKSIAQRKADGVWAEMIEAWEAKLAGDQADAMARFDAARELADVRGYRYLAAARVAQLPIDQIVDRAAAVGVVNKVPDQREMDALMGGVESEGMTISQALEDFWSLSETNLVGKSADQMRRWKNPRIKAVKNLIKIIDDKPIASITGDDMLEFRQWWSKRITSGEVTIESGNRDISHVSDILRTVNKLRRLGLDLPLNDLRFKKGDTGTRPPFPTEWITDKILADGALDGLNDQARAILLLMVNTGARPSEIAALTSDTIRLDDPHPHISIEAGVRQLKTPNARRIIPLTGVSLEAARAFPNGFDRYRKSSATLSATVNKYLKTNKLLPTDKHVLYSLRHSFEDRLLAAGVDERIRRDLMGHALHRVRYGQGASLEHAYEVVSSVAL